MFSNIQFYIFAERRIVPYGLLEGVRQNALFYDDKTSGKKKNQSENTKNCFTMKSRKCPLQVESMKSSENDLTKVIENIQFRKVSSAFLLKLDEDIKNIISSKNTEQNTELQRN